MGNRGIPGSGNDKSRGNLDNLLIPTLGIDSFLPEVGRRGICIGCRNLEKTMKMMSDFGVFLLFFPLYFFKSSPEDLFTERKRERKTLMCLFCMCSEQGSNPHPRYVP